MLIEVLILTLQNDPPTLDTSAETPDQYKNYSKTFRKMVSECLKKEPEQRPTAKQLLKHEFFKKAKVSFIYWHRHLIYVSEYSSGLFWPPMFRGLFVSVGITMSCAKMAELIEMSFGLWTGVGTPKEPCIR